MEEAFEPVSGGGEGAHFFGDDNCEAKVAEVGGRVN